MSSLLLSLSVILHDGPHTPSAWPYVLLGLGALLLVAILAGLWWASRRLPPEMDEGPDGGVGIEDS
jgi:protein-S-isoprenylcysteine O-methyltransferase Ste14